ncbi:MAG: PhnD/SsuA/transferrin family substrate-binding protein [Coriobacteriia bacterium]|nr:PhnD/SsuA/transferrin family substrate-binding protein [Coriobacteriia bacterium]
MFRSLRLLLALIVVISLGLLAPGCAGKPAGEGQQQADLEHGDDKDGSLSGASPAYGSVPVRVASLKGPTSIGLVDFMEKAEADGGGMGAAGDTQAQLIGDYSFQISGTADEILPGMVSGNLDIALVPANVAAVLYNRTNGGITAISVNTLGALYVVSADDSISSLEDLTGRTLLMTGKGTTPEYVMNHLLQQNGLVDKVSLEYKSEATELAAAISADPTAVALLPEPYVTAVTTKNPELSVRLSLADEWQRVEGAQGGKLVAGVTVVRTTFLADHPEVVEEFLVNQAASVDAALRDPGAAAQLVVVRGIIDNPQIAQKAIPQCNLVCLTGDQMQAALGSYLQVLFAADPASIGGALPGDDFYYHANAA